MIKLVQEVQQLRCLRATGELVEGWDVAVRINQLSIGKPDNTAGRDEGAVIDTGQLRSGDPIVLPDVQQATA